MRRSPRRRRRRRRRRRPRSAARSRARRRTVSVGSARPSAALRCGRRRRSCGRRGVLGSAGGRCGGAGGGLARQGGVGEDDPVALEHVVGVELADLHGLDVAQVGEGTVGDPVVGTEHHEHPARRAPARPGPPRRPWSSGPGTTTRRRRRPCPPTARSERAEYRARRIIFLGVRWRYERGLGPRATPPPDHCGERVEPWRARPVPF